MILGVTDFFQPNSFLNEPSPFVFSMLLLLTAFGFLKTENDNSLYRDQDDEIVTGPSSKPKA